MTGPDLIRQCEALGLKLTVDLQVDGPVAAQTAELLAALQVLKPQVVAALVGMAVEPGPDTDGWVARARAASQKRSSWLMGLGLLYRRRVHALDEDVRARLDALARMTPRTLAEFDAYVRRENEVLNDLEADGKLPPLT